MPTKLYRLNQLSDKAFYKATQWNKDRLEELHADVIEDDGEVLAWAADEDYWYHENGTFAKEGDK